MDGLDVINPPSREVAFRGERLQVQPLRLEQIGPFITASRSIIGRVAMVAALPDDAGPVSVGAIVMDMLEQDSSELAGALAIAVDREAKWIAAATLDEVADLIEAVAGLNRDFFARRLHRMVAFVKMGLEAEASPT